MNDDKIEEDLFVLMSQDLIGYIFCHICTKLVGDQYDSIIDLNLEKAFETRRHGDTENTE